MDDWFQLIRLALVLKCRLALVSNLQDLTQTLLICRNLKYIYVGDVGDAKTGLIPVKYMTELRELLTFTAKLVKIG